MSETPRFVDASHAPAQPLAGEQVAVLGYGHLGRTVALNLRDSGHAVRVGNVADDYAARARREGFETLSLAEASRADLVFILLPDEVIPEAFAQHIAPALKPGSAIAFASGYNLAYDLVSPPEQVDVLLVAPRMGGEEARERYEQGKGFWTYLGVERDASGKAEERMLGLATAIGSLRQGGLRMSAQMEATLDLYIEQTVGPLLGTAIMLAFAAGEKAGIPPEALVLEMYMSGEFESVFRAFRQQGFFKASENHGPTALFGGMIRTLEIDQPPIQERFEGVLQEIRDGGFARRFQDERASGYPMLKLAEAMIHADSPISAAEAAVRKANRS